MSMLLLLATSPTATSALKCWETSAVMNRLDVTKAIEAKDCGDNDKSCMAKTYSVGKMWCKRNFP